ncbi:unnamed protein product, partial [Urochloa humidicola]
KALEEEGELYGKTIYLFGSTEPQLLYVNGERKIVLIPVIIAIVDDFDWEMYDYEDFAGEKIKDESLPEDEKEKFKEFLKENVRERKRELRQAKEARKKAIDDMDPKKKEAF